MPATALAALQVANHQIAQDLTQLRSHAPDVIHSDLLTDLRVSLAETAVWLNGISGVPASPELEAEVSRYRGHLHELAQVLPTLHARMLAERSRMQSLGERYEAVQAWAKAHQSGL